MSVSTTAPGKVNLCLFLGRARKDGLHELVSLVQPVTLADSVSLGPAGPAATADEVICEGVDDPNLAGAALAGFRAATGWEAPPLRIEIAKRVPVAAGMGGGSGDAAAVLRLASEMSGLGERPLLLELAAELGADVPAQLDPGLYLVEGAGERLKPLAPLRSFLVAIVRSREQLSTADVFREADRLGLPRPAEELAAQRVEIERSLADGGPLPDAGLLVNDLEAATRSLCPSVGPSIAALEVIGAHRAMVSGSGPTVFGLFPDSAPEELADEAARATGLPVEVARPFVPADREGAGA